MADNSQASESIPDAMPLSSPAPAPAASPAVTIATAAEPIPDEPAKASLPAGQAAKKIEPGLATPAAPPASQAAPIKAPAAEVPLVKPPLAEAKPIASKPAPATPAASHIVRKPAKPAPVVAKRPVAVKIPKPPASVKPPVQTSVKPAPVVAASVAPTKPAAPVFAKPIAAKPPVVLKPTVVLKPSFFQETFIMTTPTFDFAAAFKTAFSDAQEKAKAAYEKSTVALGDASEFAKGNVEALVESSKILASGLQELTTELVAESREAFENITAEVKSIAAVKSPADFFKLQSELMRKQMDALMANGTKHSEAFLKLANDAAAPLSSRVSLAVEKVKAAA